MPHDHTKYGQPISVTTSAVGTCEQRDTGQGHPDKGTRHRSDDLSPKPRPLLLEWLWVLLKAPERAVTCVMQKNGQNQPLVGPFQRASITHVAQNLIGKELPGGHL